MKIEISAAELIELMQMKKDFKFDYQSFEDAIVKGSIKESEVNYEK